MAKVVSVVRDFIYGWANKVEEDKIRRGAASTVNNFITNAGRWELRRGMEILGNTVTGLGRITGLAKVEDANGDEKLIRTRGKKIEYLNTTNDTWTEIGSDQLGTSANGEDVAITPYTSLAGYQAWLSSPNSSLYKIMTANITDIIDMYDSTKNYKGLINILANRIRLWATRDDKTGLYHSHIDKQNYDEYTSVTSEAIGSSGSLTYTGTLAFKAGGAKRTCFGIYFTDTSETFADNFDGTLTGSAGGTGIINYATGVYSVTFKVAAVGSVTANYFWEDSTSNGIADFTESNPRVAGEGLTLRQDDGGDPIKSVLSYNNTDFCLHKNRTWEVVLTNTDTDGSNTIFREKVGIPYFRAAVATGDGIYYVDQRENEIRIRLLTLSSNSEKVIPQEISAQLDLTSYSFSQSAGVEFGDYILISCKSSGSSYNDTVLMFNKRDNTWTKLDYWVSCFAIYNNTLVAGDSVSNNVYTLFSGVDDDDNNINAIFESWEDNLGYEGLKKLKKFVAEGRIGVNQSAKLYMNFDNSGWVEYGTISGSGSYVDKGQSVAVGAVTLGTKEIGGGSSSNLINAYHYYIVITINSDKFQKLKFKIVPQGIGWFDFKSIEFRDIRYKQQNIPKKYR